MLGVLGTETVRLALVQRLLRSGPSNALFKRSFDLIAKIGRRRSIRRVESFKSVVSAPKTASFGESYDRLKLPS